MRKALLSGEDAAWLHMERADNLMVVTGVLELASPVDFSVLEALIRERLLPLDRFTHRVKEPAVRVGSPRWVPSPEFRLSDHLVRLTPGPRNEQELQEVLSSLVSQPLNRQRPLWQMHFVPQYGLGSLLLVRVHHAIADGFALLHVLLSLCDEAQLARVTVPPVSVSRPGRVGRLWGLASSLVHLVTSPVDPRTRLKGPLGVAKRVAWTRPVPLAQVRQAAHRSDATVNDVLVSCVAGALRRYLGPLPAERALHAMVPVNLRTRERALAQLGNRFGLVILPLPVRETEPLARLAGVQRTMSRVKRSAEALVAMGLLWLLGLLPVVVERLVVSFFARKASLVLTNVPGPRERLRLAGSAVSRLMFWVPQSARLALGISLISYAGQVVVGVMSDAERVPDPQVLVAGFEAELAALSGPPHPDPLPRGGEGDTTIRAD